MFDNGRQCEVREGFRFLEHRLPEDIRHKDPPSPTLSITPLEEYSIDLNKIAPDL